MGKSLDELLYDIENKLPLYVKNYSKRISSTTTTKTNIAYLNDIHTFFEYCSSSLFCKEVKDITIDDLSTLTDIDIYDYLNYLGKYEKTFLNKAGDPVTRIYTNTPTGKSRKLSAVKSLYTKLFEGNLIATNPTLTVKQNTPAYIGIRERLTKAEVMALEKTVSEGLNINTNLSEKAHARNRDRDTALMLIFLYSGIRVSELHNLSLTDIDIMNSTMTIIRKGNKRDKIPLPDAVTDFLNYYLNVRRNMVGISTKALFISQFKGRLQVKSIENIIAKYAARANITKKVTPHTIRRTFLTTFYNKTKDADSTRRIAGHDNVNTTLKYYASTSDDEFADQLHSFGY